jgi:hypothetical protein
MLKFVSSSSSNTLHSSGVAGTDSEAADFRALPSHSIGAEVHVQRADAADLASWRATLALAGSGEALTIAP